MIESMAEELNKVAIEQAESFGYMSEDYEFKENVESFKAGANWQKEQLVVWLKSEADYLMQELKKGNKAYGLAEQYRAQLYKEIVNKLKEL